MLRKTHIGKFLCKVINTWVFHKSYSFLLLFLFLTSCHNISLAQDYTSVDKKAIKHYEFAMRAMNTRNAELAEAYLSKAIDQDPNFVEAWLLKYEASSMSGNNEEAKKCLEMALSVNPDFFPNAHFLLGELYMREGDYKSADKSFRNFLKYDDTPSELITFAALQLENCNFAQDAMLEPVDFEPLNLGPGVNSELNEYYPSITTDDKLLIYTRRLRDEQGNEQEDFYQAYFENGNWVTRGAINDINTIRNEGAPAISPDGSLLVFTACADNSGYYGEDKVGMGSCDLFYCLKQGERWTRPENLGTSINTPNWETQPSVSSDGKTIYFTRGYRKKGQSGYKEIDIWKSELNENGQWSLAEKLGPNINTDQTESSVLIHPDNQTLYFSSNGHIGMGGEDIFMSRKGEDGEWGIPVNLGYPINTYNNENSLLVSARGEIAYFASNREGGLGGLDLYSFVLPKNMQPSLVSFFKGKVRDADTKKPLGVKFELIDVSTGKVIIESYSDPVDGTFLLSIPSGKEYALNVSAKGYMFYSDHFAHEEKMGEPAEKIVDLQPIKAGASVILNNVFFETDRFDLKPESRAELDKLIQFLNRNYKTTIELSGHTDNQGTDEHNLNLSNNRARVVRDYLVEHAIPAERLSYKGYGAMSPIADNDSETGRALNRRTEMKLLTVD